MEDKKALRSKMKETLKNLDPDKQKEWTATIHERIFNLNEWKEANIIAVTISLGDEIDTRDIIDRAWEEGKMVAVPKCLPKEKHLDFRKITTYDQLETVYYGLLEPKADNTVSISKTDFDMIIVPGLIFDREGFRIGFGGGYYDRFLSETKAIKISQAFDQQLIDSIPRETHDIPVDIILTPSALIDCGSH